MTAQTIAIKALDADTLGEAYQGSYYTIAGAAAADAPQWIDMIIELLAKEGVGRPTEWFTTTGADVNAFAMKSGRYPHPDDLFRNDLGLLMFKPTGHMGRLALFKVKMEDRWFDDIIDNMKRRAR
ncbi:hypothetical protein SEA_RASPUTIA_6 [Microbacterium phage Rasputia]|nr:hypothetical protein SEA_RASPUTIA_6 [Microbacterium phage Rasputia]